MYCQHLKKVFIRSFGGLAEYTCGLSALTFTLTSPLLGGSTTIVSRVKGSFGSRATIALQVIGLPAVPPPYRRP